MPTPEPRLDEQKRVMCWNCAGDGTIRATSARRKPGDPGLRHCPVCQGKGTVRG